MSENTTLAVILNLPDEDDEFKPQTIQFNNLVLYQQQINSDSELTKDQLTLINKIFNSDRSNPNHPKKLETQEDEDQKIVTQSVSIPQKTFASTTIKANLLQYRKKQIYKKKDEQQNHQAKDQSFAKEINNVQLTFILFDQQLNQTLLHGVVWFLSRLFIMRVGVEYIQQNLNTIINGYESDQSSQCQNLINSFTSALKSCLSKTFYKIFNDGHFRQEIYFQICFGFQVQVETNFSKKEIGDNVDLFLSALIEKFKSIQLIGDKVNESIDMQDSYPFFGKVSDQVYSSTESLEICAIFHKNKLVSCSEAFLKLHLQDQSLVKLISFQQDNYPEETKIYLTATGIINEAGVTMPQTVCRYAYRLINISLQNECQLMILCGQTLQVEELIEWIDFQFGRSNFDKNYDENIIVSQLCLPQNKNYFEPFSKSEQIVQKIEAYQIGESPLKEFLFFDSENMRIKHWNKDQETSYIQILRNKGQINYSGKQQKNFIRENYEILSDSFLHNQYEINEYGSLILIKLFNITQLNEENKNHKQKKERSIVAIFIYEKIQNKLQTKLLVKKSIEFAQELMNK